MVRQQAPAVWEMLAGRSCAEDVVTRGSQGCLDAGPATPGRAGARES
jgi:hypothetical protein